MKLKNMVLLLLLCNFHRDDVTGGWLYYFKTKKTWEFSAMFSKLRMSNI